jgi:hypothetical protein
MSHAPLTRREREPPHTRAAVWPPGIARASGRIGATWRAHVRAYRVAPADPRSDHGSVTALFPGGFTPRSALRSRQIHEGLSHPDCRCRRVLAMDDADSDGDELGYKVPLGSLDNVELGGLPPIAPDGGFTPGPIGMSPSVPAATPEHFMCLRGPCRHYWQLETFFASGNPMQTWDAVDGLKDSDGKPVRMPRQISRSCLAQPGMETELTDDVVYECSRWDPLSPREVRRLERRREKYYKIRPNHRSKE